MKAKEVQFLYNQTNMMNGNNIIKLEVKIKLNRLQKNDIYYG
jgi:hypothetical protein